MIDFDGSVVIKAENAIRALSNPIISNINPNEYEELVKKRSEIMEPLKSTA